MSHSSKCVSNKKAQLSLTNPRNAWNPGQDDWLIDLRVIQGNRKWHHSIACLVSYYRHTVTRSRSAENCSPGVCVRNVLMQIVYVCVYVLVYFVACSVLLFHKFAFLAAGKQRAEADKPTVVVLVFVGTILHYNWSWRRWHNCNCCRLFYLRRKPDKIIG